MEFKLTEEQREMRDATREYVTDELEPVANTLDRNHAYPASHLTELAEQGVMGLTVSRDYEGLGCDLVTYALVVEELAVALMSVPSVINVHLITASLLDAFGKKSLKREYLSEMANFQCVGAFGLTEPGAGSDNASMTTRARKDGDEWVIDGQKRWITNAPNADVVSIFAKTGPEENRHHNISAFLVPTDADGFEVGQAWETLGLNSIDSCDLHLNGVRVGEDHLLGERDEGFMHLVQGLTIGRVNVAARCTGLARAALEDSVDYAREREQFGNTIAEFQGIRWKIADMAVNTNVSRLLTLWAADRASRDVDDRGFEASVAKLFASEAAVENALEGIQIHGGYGYTKEYDVERYLRDAKLLTIGEGTNEIHRNIIADRVFEKF